MTDERTALRDAHTIDKDLPSNSLGNVQQACAIQLATGLYIDTDAPDQWPVGVVIAWNSAAKAGAFDQAKTIGDMAEAFLSFQLESLTSRRTDK